GVRPGAIRRRRWEWGQPPTLSWRAAWAADAEWMSGKSRARLAPVLTKASSGMSDRSARQLSTMPAARQDSTWAAPNDSNRDAIDVASLHLPADLRTSELFLTKVRQPVLRDGLQLLGGTSAAFTVCSRSMSKPPSPRGRSPPGPSGRPPFYASAVTAG